jgi:hypothetical protein
MCATCPAHLIFLDLITLIIKVRTYHKTILNVGIKVKVKGKVVPVLLLTEHHTMKVYWGVEL